MEIPQDYYYFRKTDFIDVARGLLKMDETVANYKKISSNSE